MIYKVGVAGCGRIASAFDNDPKRKYIATHIGAYTYAGNTRVVAICDTDRKKLKTCLGRWGIERGYLDCGAMLAKEKIDILSVCTPPKSHLPVVKEAVKSGSVKAIFCEKPLSDNVRDAREILNLCGKKGIILQVGHQRRFDPLHVKIGKIIQAKKIGDVQQVSFYYTAGVKNTGSHMFDLLRFLFGNVEWIEGFFSKNPSNIKDDPNIDGILKFKNRVMATFQACEAKKYLIFELKCLAEKGSITVKNSGFSADFCVSGPSNYYSGYNELRKTRTPFNTRYERNFMVNAVRHFTECIEKGKEPVSSGADGLAALKLVEAALHSAKNDGKRIFIK